MANLIRLTYVSKATFDCGASADELVSEVQDILAEARRNNQKSKVSGALFFGEGYFFQCLEGKPSLVLPLVEKIKTDPRHESFKISYQKAVPRRYFLSWSMKGSTAASSSRGGVDLAKCFCLVRVKSKSGSHHRYISDPSF